MFSHMQNLEFFLKKDMKIEGDYLGWGWEPAGGKQWDKRGQGGEWSDYIYTCIKMLSTQSGSRTLI
jgi:hypothetical protein